MVRNILNASMIKALAALSLLVLNAMLARWMPIDEMSKYLTLNAGVIFLINVACWGAPLLSVRRIAEHPSDIIMAKQTVLFYGCLVAVNGLAIATIYLSVSRYAGEDKDLSVMTGFVIAVWVALGSVLRVIGESFRGIGFLSRANTMVAVNSHGLAVTVLLLAGVAVWYVCGMQITVDVIAVGCATSLLAVILIAMSVFYQDKKPISEHGIQERSYGLADVAAVFRSGTMIILPQLCIYMMTQGDIWFAEIWSDAAETALYGISSRTAFVAAFVLIALQASTVPIVSIFKQTGDIDYVHKQLAKGVSMATAFALVFLGVSVGYGDKLLALIYGDPYGDAWGFLVVFCIGHMISAATGPCGVFMLMLGHERQVFWITTTVFAIYIVSIYKAGPEFGAMGIAISSAACFAIVNILNMVALKMKVGIYTGIQIRRYVK